MLNELLEDADNSADIDQILQDEFFARSYPKTLDRNHFYWINDLFKHHKKEDIIATLTDLTASTISQNINSEIKQIYLCGGGSKNTFLTNLIR